MRCKLCWLTLVVAVNVQAATITGRVFRDLDADGAYDAGEPPVAGAVVSDERSLAVSGADGKYTLEAEGPGDIFVVNPSGTWPSGPWWRPAGSAGPIDFALRQDDQPAAFNFVQGTDMHVFPTAEEPYRRYVQHVNACPAPIAFVVHTGDLVRDASMATPEAANALYDLYQDWSAGLQRPLREVLGNHEILSVLNPSIPDTVPGYGRGLYRRRVGPVTYAFRYGGCHFITLDGNQIKDRQVLWTLSPESAEWAAWYLAKVPAGEPVVLLIHEPLGNGEPEQKLLAALQGKTLLGTLCGHGHERSVTRWGGAPQVMGGAVSYAWHGHRPFPPQPYGYVVYRVADGTLSWVFRDWAEERSIDLGPPWFRGTSAGRLEIKGVIDDLTGEVVTARATLSELKADLAVARRDELATTLTGSLDASALPDGVHELVVEAIGRGDQTWRRVMPLVFLNQRPTPLESAEPATLTVSLKGADRAGNQVLVNGEPVADITAASGGQVVRVELPAGKLRRLNEVTVRAAAHDDGPDKLQVGAVVLAYAGRKHCDVRFAVTGISYLRGLPGKTVEVTRYLDLTYTGERGLAP